MSYLSRFIDLIESGGAEAHSLDQASFAAHMASALPAGIIASPENFSNLDFTVTNRMNMRAVDELILNAVITMRESMDERGTLHVVMGEVHNLPAYIMAKAGLIDNLGEIFNDTSCQRYKTTFAVEHPYNKLGEYIKSHYQLPVTDAQKYTLHTHDPNGHIFARAVMAKNRYLAAPRAMNQFLATVLRQNTPIALVDAAYKLDDFNLDKHDGLTYKIAQALFKIDLHKQYIPVHPSTRKRDSRGLQIRNGVMARRIIDIAAKGGIVVTGTGLNHLGNKNKGLDFKTALPAKMADITGEHDRIITISPAAARNDYTPETITPDGTHDKIIPIYLRGLAENKVNEKRSIRRLGRSYSEKKGFWSGLFRDSIIPQRFHPAETPGYDTAKRELRDLLERYP